MKQELVNEIYKVFNEIFEELKKASIGNAESDSFRTTILKLGNDCRNKGEKLAMLADSLPASNQIPIFKDEEGYF